MNETRRDFLKTALGISTLFALGAPTPFTSARAAPCAHRPDRVLVLLQLSGGNDGLNTIVPYGDDEYGRNRTTLRLPERRLHRIDDYLGFHPRMKALARLYHDGVLGIVQGVGCGGSSRNHAPAMRTWYTADPSDTIGRTGWIGRVADSVGGPEGVDVPAVFVSSSSRPLAIQAERSFVPKIRSLDDVVGGRGIETASSPERASDRGDPLLEFMREKSRDTAKLRQALGEAADAATSTADYPGFRLAGDLRTVAQLIRANLGISIYFTELGGDGFGGFDNHANQLGNHCALLQQLSESVAAFVDDLRQTKLLDRVFLMTFSEFGRTLPENGRRGTGHGEAAPVLLAGGCLAGGLTGKHPSLTDLEQAAPRCQIDFRRIYATALEEWLGIESEEVLGGRYEPVEMLRT